ARHHRSRDALARRGLLEWARTLLLRLRYLLSAPIRVTVSAFGNLPKRSLDIAQVALVHVVLGLVHVGVHELRPVREILRVPPLLLLIRSLLTHARLLQFEHLIAQPLVSAAPR